MMKKTLFLDFDGPLFEDRGIRFDPDQNKRYPGYVEMPEMVTYWKMSPLTVTMLNMLYDMHPFQTVVSSTWKEFINQEQCEDLFAVNGLKLHLAEPWRTLNLKTRPSRCFRKDEIVNYMIDHNIAEYMILDDPWSGSSLDEHDAAINPDQVIMVDPDVGLRSSDYMRMLKIVRKWANIPEPISHLWGL